MWQSVNCSLPRTPLNGPVRRPGRHAASRPVLREEGCAHNAGRMTIPDPAPNLIPDGTLGRAPDRTLTPISSPAALNPAERWQLAAGDAATATLVIPADARRERRFEIACAVTVNVPAAAVEPTLQMSVLANGAQQWRRRATAHNPGAWDGLDYRFARSVPVGQALRITVAVAGSGVRRRSLVIEADEV